MLALTRVQSLYMYLQCTHPNLNPNVPNNLHTAALVVCTLSTSIALVSTKALHDHIHSMSPTPQPSALRCYIEYQLGTDAVHYLALPELGPMNPTLAMCLPYLLIVL
jgi:hypothetical protein